MKYTQKLDAGRVYFLENYTAPKYFNGLYFECLLTDQKIAAHSKIVRELCLVTEYEGKIWRPERFL